MLVNAQASASSVETLWIVWSGFRDGAEYARLHSAPAACLDAERVVVEAARASDRNLPFGAPLEHAAIQPAYRYGWMAGYLAAQRERERAVDAPLHDVSGSAAHATSRLHAL